jgi:ABC-type transport system substrate-binding protein
MTVEVRTHPDSATYNDFIRPAAASPEFGAYQNPHRRYDMYGALEMKTYLAADPPNYAYWVNEEVDALVQQAIAATDPEEYAALGRQLSVIVADQCPYIPTKAVQVGIVAHKDFTGYTPLGEYYFAYTRPYDWDVTTS